MGEEISTNEEIKAIEIIEHIKNLFNDQQEKNRFFDFVAKYNHWTLESMKEIFKKLLLD